MTAFFKKDIKDGYAQTLSSNTSTLVNFDPLVGNINNTPLSNCNLFISSLAFGRTVDGYAGDGYSIDGYSISTYTQALYNIDGYGVSSLIGSNQITHKADGYITLADTSFNLSGNNIIFQATGVSSYIFNWYALLEIFIRKMT
jgi:hypothetical protein